MISAAKRVPNFAGVALVDILANGVAVLIIVIVLSIASRFEQEQEYNERIQEISAVMTREFSTSLVLNRLASGPPAQLHDYENSELDRIWDPIILPVLEIHSNGVRDPYTNRFWTRAELLQEPNSLDDFLAAFSELQRTNLRGDFYDIGSFYLLMSILKDHQIVIRHWHFIGAPGIGPSTNWGACPPGVAAKDCVGTGSGNQTSRLNEVFDSLTNGDSDGSNQGEGDWPPQDASFGEGDEMAGSTIESLPEGTQLGPGPSGTGGTGLESFPDARASRNQMMGRGSSGTSSGQGEPSGLSIRLADPNAQAIPLGGLNLAALRQDTGSFLTAFMAFLDEIQRLYDNNQPPTEALQQFIPLLQSYLEEPPELTEAQRIAVEDLELAIDLHLSQGYARRATEPLLTMAMPPSAHPEAFIRLAVNRLLIEAEIQSNNVLQLDSLPAEARFRFNVQAYPDIWRGLQITADRNAVLVMSPDQSEPDIPKWRSIAYIAPQMDDFVVGFVHGTYDPDGHIEVISETNQSLVNTIRLMPEWIRNPFSIQTWMTLLYVTAGIVLLALLFFWRPGTRVRR